MSRILSSTLKPVLEAERIRRAYHRASGLTASELIDAEDALDRARRRRIGSELAEIMIAAIPGASATKNINCYVTAVIATAEACGEAMSPLSCACTVAEFVRREKTLPPSDEFAVWHRAELARINVLATDLESIPTPPPRRVHRDAA